MACLVWHGDLTGAERCPRLATGLIRCTILHSDVRRLRRLRVIPDVCKRRRSSLQPLTSRWARLLHMIDAIRWLIGYDDRLLLVIRCSTWLRLMIIDARLVTTDVLIVVELRRQRSSSLSPVLHVLHVCQPPDSRR